MADESPDEPSMAELEDWLCHVEDKAWIAERDAAVSRFVLGNLVLELGRSGLIDARQFIQRLQAAAHLHPDHPKAVKEFLDELHGCLPPPADGESGGEPGEPRVFH